MARGRASLIADTAPPPYHTASSLLGCQASRSHSAARRQQPQPDAGRRRTVRCTARSRVLRPSCAARSNNWVGDGAATKLAEALPRLGQLRSLALA